MNIIRALSALVLCLLVTCFGRAALTPMGPPDFASGATGLDFSALADNTEGNGLVLDAVLFHVTKNSVDGGLEQPETLRHPTWSRCQIQMALP